MGEEKEHSRFTLVTRAAPVARRGFPLAAERLAALETPHDIALRLERNRWNGMVEPRVILRALCPTEAGELRVLGEDEALLGGAAPRCWRHRRPGSATARLSSRTARARASRVWRATCSRAASRCSWPWPTSPPQRGLEAVVAGLVGGPMPVVSWAALAARPELAAGFGTSWRSTRRRAEVPDPLLGASPRAPTSPGVRPRRTSRSTPNSTCVLSSPRSTSRCAPQGAGRTARGGPVRGAIPAARGRARLVRVLTELGLVELDLDAPASVPGARPGSATSSLAHDLSEPRAARGDRRTPARAGVPRPPPAHSWRPVSASSGTPRCHSTASSPGRTMRWRAFGYGEPARRRGPGGGTGATSRAPVDRRRHRALRRPRRHYAAMGGRARTHPPDTGDPHHLPARLRGAPPRGGPRQSTRLSARTRAPDAEPTVASRGVLLGDGVRLYGSPGTRGGHPGGGDPRRPGGDELLPRRWRHLGST